MEKVIIFGEGNIQEVTLFYLQQDNMYDVVAFTADIEYIKSDIYLGLPMIPFADIEKLYSPLEYKMFIPLGYKRNNHLRAEKYYEAKSKGYSFITYISSKATCYGTLVGENCFILENSIIQPYTAIGDNTILWNGCNIAHHTKIGKHCFIAAQAVVNGVTVVEDYTFIGANATIGNGIRVAKDNLIGAGAVVLKDTLEKEVYVPSRSILLNKKSDEISID